MSSRETTPRVDAPLSQDLLQAARYYLGGRRILLVLAAAALVAGLAFNWSWLVAAGVAPLLIALAPCAAMCALGLCMHRMGRPSPSGEADAEDPDERPPSDPAARGKTRDS